MDTFRLPSAPPGMKLFRALKILIGEAAPPACGPASLPILELKTGDGRDGRDGRDGDIFGQYLVNVLISQSYTGLSAWCL